MNFVNKVWVSLYAQKYENEFGCGVIHPPEYKMNFVIVTMNSKPIVFNDYSHFVLMELIPHTF